MKINTRAELNDLYTNTIVELGKEYNDKILKVIDDAKIQNVDGSIVFEDFRDEIVIISLYNTISELSEYIIHFYIDIIRYFVLSQTGVDPTPNIRDKVKTDVVEIAPIDQIIADIVWDTPYREYYDGIEKFFDMKDLYNDAVEIISYRAEQDGVDLGDICDAVARDHEELFDIDTISDIHLVRTKILKTERRF